MGKIVPVENVAFSTFLPTLVEKFSVLKIRNRRYFLAKIIIFCGISEINIRSRLNIAH